jgi:hypothetical protein
MFEANLIRDPHSFPKRKRFSYYELEEYGENGGMWGQGDLSLRTAAAALLGEPDTFLECMRLVIRNWPKSCINALTNPSLNQIAWIGQAGCYLGTGAQQDVTRLAWYDLTSKQQSIANRLALRVINEWREMYRSSEPDGQMVLFEPQND